MISHNPLPLKQSNHVSLLFELAASLTTPYNALQNLRPVPSEPTYYSFFHLYSALATRAILSSLKNSRIVLISEP